MLYVHYTRRGCHVPGRTMRAKQGCQNFYGASRRAARLRPNGPLYPDKRILHSNEERPSESGAREGPKRERTGEDLNRAG